MFSRETYTLKKMGKEHTKTDEKGSGQKLNWKKRKFNSGSNASDSPDTSCPRPSADKANLNQGYNPLLKRPNLANIICYKCQKRGHYANDCRSKTPGESTAKPS